MCRAPSTIGSPLPRAPPHHPLSRLDDRGLMRPDLPARAGSTQRPRARPAVRLVRTNCGRRPFRRWCWDLGHAGQGRAAPALRGPDLCRDRHTGWRGRRRTFGERVRYFYRENDGTAGIGARWQSINESKGDWIALLDHDDRWLPAKLERQREAVKTFPETGVVLQSFATSMTTATHWTQPVRRPLPAKRDNTIHTMRCTICYVPIHTVRRRP